MAQDWEAVISQGMDSTLQGGFVKEEEAEA